MNTEGWKIKSIRMDGLLHRHDIYYQLHPKINILGGANGSGKSTILHALAHLLEVLRSSVKREENIHCEAQFDSIATTFLSGLVLKMEKEVSTSKEVIGVEEIKGQKKNRVNVHETLSFKTRIHYPEDKEDVLVPNHVVYVNSSDLAIRTISHIAEISVSDGRPGKTVLDVLLRDALNTRNQLFTARIGGVMQSSDKPEIENLLELFGRFDKAVKRFMPEYTLKDTSTLTFTRNDDKETDIMYFRLSTGEKQLLYILLTVCNTMGEATILLLDEADTGLHIDWKKILLREILAINPNMQVIAATHSPSLIDGWYDNVREVSQLYVDSTQLRSDESEWEVKTVATEE